jgi:pilus assembly protein Flp/PilA
MVTGSSSGTRIRRILLLYIDIRRNAVARHIGCPEMKTKVRLGSFLMRSPIPTDMALRAERKDTMLSLLSSFWNDEMGQGLTEYALILALVSIGLIAVLVIFRDAIGGIFARIAQVLQGAPSEGYTP